MLSGDASSFSYQIWDLALKFPNDFASIALETSITKLSDSYCNIFLA